MCIHMESMSIYITTTPIILDKIKNKKIPPINKELESQIPFKLIFDPN